MKTDKQNNINMDQELPKYEHLTEDEIIEILKKRLVKGDYVKKICSDLNINEDNLFGCVKQLKDEKINVSLSNKTDDIFLMINNSPDYTKENFYSITEPVDEPLKIGVISDPRFGSRNEQIALLNDAYKKFAKEGVKYVIITGNLLEGKYTGQLEQKYGKSLIMNDANGQVDHFIKYFPKVEGIKTLFITGDTDHTWGKDLNVGECIADERDDMIYLGPKSCTLKINNANIRLDNLEKKGESYTVSYPPQKYIRSLASYEDYDFILLGGTLTAQDFPKIRDTRVFAIPSMVARTPKMSAASQQNMMGTYQFEISFDKLGKVKRLVSELSPYYTPSKENYLTIKPLELTKDEEKDEFINHNRKVEEKNELLARYDRLYKSMRKEERFDDLKKRFEKNDNELNGIIDVLQQYGRPINIVDINGEKVVQKIFQQRRHYDVKPPKEELTKKTFGVVSDTHYGSRWSQPSMVNTFVYEGYNRGITDYFHVGDVSDGDYHTIRPNHVNEVFIYGATAHGDYAAKTLPKYPGVNWKVICGSHDQSHTFNYGPFDFGTYLASKRPDVTYLGQDRGFFYYDNCKIELFHPGGGTSRILSTKPQNGIDQLDSGIKPKLSLRGHYHKVYYMMYRNIHTLLCPCNVDQSSFMMKNEIPNLMGDYFITIWYDDNGDIQYIETEPMIFDQSSVRENDWENPIRNMKHRTLSRKIA